MAGSEAGGVTGCWMGVCNGEVCDGKDGGRELACASGPGWDHSLRGMRRRRRGCRRRRDDLRDIYVAGQGGQALLRIGHHLAYPIAARLQLKGHVNIHPSLEKLRQLSISNVYVCVPLLGNHQIFFLIEYPKNKGQRIEVMAPFLSKME